MNLKALALALGMAAVASSAVAGGKSIDLSSSEGSFVGGSSVSSESVDENSFAKRSDSEGREGPRFSKHHMGHGGHGHEGHVPAVPEPETYALLAAGLCVVAMLSRRRRRD